MVAKSKSRMPLELRTALTVIDNSLADEEIGGAVEQLGYPKAILQEGKRICDAAIAAVSRHTDMVETFRKASIEKLTAKNSARDAFQAFYGMAKASFGKSILISIGLSGPKLRTTDAFLAKTYEAFDNAAKLPQIQEILTQAGFDQARLHADRMKIATFEMALQTLKAAQDARKQATEDKNKALHDLKEWLEPYLNAARSVFHDKKELLEKFGIDIRKESKVTQPIAFVPVMPSVCASAVATPSTLTNTTALKPGPNLALL
jgi:hypothetical protein